MHTEQRFFKLITLFITMTLVSPLYSTDNYTSGEQKKRLQAAVEYLSKIASFEADSDSPYERLAVELPNEYYFAWGVARSLQLDPSTGNLEDSLLLYYRNKAQISEADELYKALSNFEHEGKYSLMRLLSPFGDGTDIYHTNKPTSNKELIDRPGLQKSSIPQSLACDLESPGRSKETAFVSKFIPMLLEATEKLEKAITPVNQSSSLSSKQQNNKPKKTKVCTIL